MLRKIMTAVFVTVATIATVAPAAMKISDMCRGLAEVTEQASDDKAAALNDAALPGDADKDEPEGGRAARHAEAGAARSMRKAGEDSRPAERDESVTVMGQLKARARDLAMNCGKALRGSNLFNSDMLGMLTGMAQHVMSGK